MATSRICLWLSGRTEKRRASEATRQGVESACIGFDVNRLVVVYVWKLARFCTARDTGITHGLPETTATAVQIKQPG
jgi:hypothetical protein